MKFFTRAWTTGEMTDEDAEAVVPAYWRYLKTLELPLAVENLSTLNPHDAYILDVEHEPQIGSLQLRLRYSDLETGYFDAILNFTGVTINPSHLTILTEARRPARIEILYDEIDRAGSAVFEYRLLLYPSGEIAFQFKDIKVTRVAVKDRNSI